MPEKDLFQLFKKFNISYKNYEHEPVFTVADGLHLQKQIPGAHSKNLFLRNKKKSYYCLVSVLEEKIIDLKKLSDILGHGRLSFGSAEDMKRMLKLSPGSVCPYGLIYDTKNQIDFILDQDFLTFETINFHPMTNSMTVSIGSIDFCKFMKEIGHGYSAITIPTLTK